MDEREIYEYLKSASLIDILTLVARYNNIPSSNNDDIDVYYTAKDLYRLYPRIFSKYKLDKYIRKEKLPVIRDGKDRLFLKSNVEEWLRLRNLSKFGK